jgi:hypothetical protein
MTKWSFEELNRLCNEKAIPHAEAYQNALAWRWKRADYHAEIASEVWSNLYKESFSFFDQRCNEAIFSYEAQVESCLLALHSLGDILSQIINVLVLSSKFREDLVSIKKVIDIMEKKSVAPDIARSARRLTDDEVFNYIEAFCNTIKHRRLIKTNFRAEYGKNTRNESGLLFEGFVFKGNIYPETWGSEILQKYRFRMLDLITEVGLSINKYVSSI